MERDEFARWARAAGGRPEWLVWGKARPSDKAEFPAHPLLCHMLDVAAVARRLLTDVLPPAVVERAAKTLAVPQEDAIAWLTFFAAGHDFGKASPPFQAKVPEAASMLVGAGFDIPRRVNVREHAWLGAPLFADVLEGLGFEPVAAARIARAVAAHHGTFPGRMDPPSKYERGTGSAWGDARKGIEKALLEALALEGKRAPAMDEDDHAFFALLAGLTAVADWIGSMEQVFAYVDARYTVAEYWAMAQERAARALEVVGMRRAANGNGGTFEALFEDKKPRDLHVKVQEIAATLEGPALVLIEGPMGIGKTEAALHVADALAARAGHRGIYMGLPTQATANQMLGRVANFLKSAYPQARSNLHLAHGESTVVDGYLELLRAVYDAKGDGGVVAEEWFAKGKRILLAGYGVGTIDQALLSVLRVRHGFVRLFGLAGKTVIFDEIHAYDTYTAALMGRLVAWLRALGSSVVLLSATLPSQRRAELLAAFGGTSAPAEHVPYPRITIVQNGTVSPIGFKAHKDRQDITLVAMPDDRDAVAHALAERIRDGGCAGWICNTVGRAQDAYCTLRALRDQGVLPRDTELLLIHARFLAGDRVERERRIEQWLGRDRERPRRSIVVGTQVLEQSLDIDFDLLATDVAPIDLVLQRVGRMHRHERPRPKGLEAPELLLVVPSGDPVAADLRSIAGVYVPYLLRRTLIALEGRKTFALPDDIEPLVEEVYTEPDPPHLADALAADREAHEQLVLGQGLGAIARMLPRPDDPDDPFDTPEPIVEEDAPEIHVSLRAVTRLGDPSIDVVCLHGTADEAFLDVERQVPISTQGRPGEKEVEALLRNSVGLSTKGLVPALCALPVPPAWERSPILRSRRVLFFSNGECRVDRFCLRLDPEVGLVIQRHDEKGKP